MEKKLDWEDFREKLGPWAESLRPFVESEKMYDIFEKIKTDAKKEMIVPTSDNTFRAFSTSNPDNIKVIFYLMDPYPKRYKTKICQATGIAMDCSNSPDGALQPSLEIFYDGLDKELGKKVMRSPSLEYLQKQGIMFLNTDLTCKLNKTSSHEGLWEPFQEYFLQEVMGKKANIIYVLCGNVSHKMEKYINPIGNYIFKIEHPVSASYKHTDWNTKNVFKKINMLLKEEGYAVEWDRREWDSTPF